MKDNNEKNIPNVNAPEEKISETQTAAEAKKAKRREREKPIIVSKGAGWSVREAYKTARTNIMFALAGEEGCKKIIITSPTPGEGKTTTVLNVAITFAQTGARVLVMDSDLRKPKVHKYLNIENEKGLTNVLGGFEKLEDCLQKTEFGIDCLTSGQIPPNPAELLASKKMQSTLNELGELYDYIFMDSPPINVVSEASLVAKYMTGVVLVVRYKYTLHNMIEKALNTLEFADAKVLGFIFNDVEPTRYSYSTGYKYNYRGSPSYGYSYGYGYGYGYEYRTRAEEARDKKEASKQEDAANAEEIKIIGIDDAEKKIEKKKLFKSLFGRK